MNTIRKKYSPAPIAFKSVIASIQLTVHTKTKEFFDPYRKNPRSTEKF